MDGWGQDCTICGQLFLFKLILAWSFVRLEGVARVSEWKGLSDQVNQPTSREGVKRG